MLGIPSDDALRRAVQLHHDATWASLTFRPSLVRLLDDTHCQAISDALRDLGTAWEIRRAVPDLYLQLPDTSGLYMFVWRPMFQLKCARDSGTHDFPWVLYVGQAGGGSSNATLRERYRGGYSQALMGDPNNLFSSQTPSNRDERIRRYLRVRPLEFWWTEITDVRKMVQLEKRLIGMLQPPLNEQHNKGRIAVRAGKITVAFQEQ